MRFPDMINLPRFLGVLKHEHRNAFGSDHEIETFVGLWGIRRLGWDRTFFALIFVVLFACHDQLRIPTAMSQSARSSQLRDCSVLPASRATGFSPGFGGSEYVQVYDRSP